MSTASTPSSGLSLQPRANSPASGGAPAAGPVSSAGMGSLDPIKLLSKYKWLLVAATIVGAVLGFVGNYAWAKLHPIYRSNVLFQCSAPVTGAGVDAGNFIEVEMTRFMGTEARSMTSDTVLQRVVEDPDIKNIKKWTTPFIMPDGTFNKEEALEELRDTVGARVVSQTVLIELTATFTDKYEATALVKLVKEKYLAVLADQGTAKRDSLTDSFRQNLTNIEAEISRLELTRETIIKNERIDSLDERMGATAMELQGINQELIDVTLDIQALTKQQEQMEAEFTKPGGITYSDELKGDVERDPLIIDVKQRIAALEQQQQSLLANGYNREHRYFKSLQSQIDGATVNLDDTRRTLLNDRFTSQLDTIRNVIGQRQAQESNLNKNKAELTVRRTNLTRIQSTLDDIRRQIDDSLTAKAEATAKLEEIKMLDSLANANRVIVVQAERPPNEMAFPKLAFLMPLGVIMMVGLVGGSVLLRELLDQRVKGPSDIFMIPRTRLVGWIPDASEDPAGQGAVETAFRDRPKGVVAESYRQIRSSLTKRIENSGHKSIMVMSGNPGSGSTATVANLGLAFAATDKRVLIVDANLRRPALHRVFGLQESPGMADVLGKSVALADAVQATSTPNLSVLTVGSKDARLPERLGNDAVSAFLAEAKRTYDIVLLDAPPAIVAGDGISLAHRCDAAILVVKAFSEKRGLVARVRNELSDMKGEFFGIVVNSVKSAAGGYMRGNFKAAQDYQQQG